MAAALVYMLLATKFDITVVDSVHIPGTSNVVCDDLSRYACMIEDLDVPEGSISDCSPDSSIGQMVQLCDPTISTTYDSEASFTTFWKSIYDVINRFPSRRSR